MSQVLYGEQSWNPLARTVELAEDRLRVGRRTTPLGELHLAAMAEAFLRGRWLGGGGAERPLHLLPEGPGVVPVTRVTGTTRPVRTRKAAAFARLLGELAVRHSGGPAQVAALADRARAEGVPLWIARRFAPGPAGPVTVAVDRRLVRADVWGPRAPVVRLRAPGGYDSRDRSPSRGLHVTVGEAAAELVLKDAMRRSRRRVEVRIPGRAWAVTRESAVTSLVRCDDRPVAVLSRPASSRPVPDPGALLLPLTPVRLEGGDPLDAVMAHFFAVAFGIGDTTGSPRFRSRRPPTAPAVAGEPVGSDLDWGRPWFTNLGSGSEDNEPGGSDGWGSDGGDGGSGSDGGTDSGGGDGGGGGGGD
ncbi:hypothetical protein [Streptomyces sp. enrichment culture]|uniref:hypothetical protein n=1 Tax=Streptomyces sp. enrichment culture TaxID=1795815 RepID=UPI003F56AC1D